jgi:hypothetical protein
VRAPVYALVGFVLWMLGAEDLLLGGPVSAFVALPVAFLFELAAGYRAVRNLRRGGSVLRGAAIGALLVAVPVLLLDASGLLILFSPQQ